jgi:hypothetical protein
VGAVAGIAAAIAYAVYPGALVAERTSLLEPFLNLLLLAASFALLADDESPALTALAFVAACMVKIWAAFYVPAMILVVRSWRAGWRLAAWVGAFAVLLLGPVLLWGGRQVVTDIVFAQAGRPRMPVGLRSRVADLLGVPAATHSALIVGIGAVLLVSISAIAISTAGRYGRYWTVVTVGAVATLLSGPSYFHHYAAFVAPGAAALVGTTANLLAHAQRRVLVGAGSLAAAACGWLGFATAAATLPGRWEVPAAAPAPCVFTDDPSLAVVSGVLHPGASTCATWVDPRGDALVAHATTATRTSSRFLAPAWQSELDRRVHEADELVLDGPLTHHTDWPASLRWYVQKTFVPDDYERDAQDLSIEIWRRRERIVATTSGPAEAAPLPSAVHNRIKH